MRGRSVFVLAAAFTLALGLVAVGGTQKMPGAGSSREMDSAGGAMPGDDRSGPDADEGDAGLATPRAPGGLDGPLESALPDLDDALGDADDATPDLSDGAPDQGDLPTGPGAGPGPGDGDLPDGPDVPDRGDDNATNETPPAPPEVIFDDSDSPFDFAPAFRFGVASKAVAVDLKGRDGLRLQVDFTPYGTAVGVSNAVSVRLLDPEQRTVASCSAGGPVMSSPTQCVRLVAAEQGSWTLTYDGQGSYKAATRILLS